MKVDDMIRPIHTILLIFDKMDIPIRPGIFPYLNHRTRTDLNVLLLRSLTSQRQDPDGEIVNSGKSIFEIRIPNFCYIQVIVFDLSYLKNIKSVFHNFLMEAYLLSPNRCHCQIAKVKNYNLNETEILISDFKHAFSRNFQLHRH